MTLQPSNYHLSFIDDPTLKRGSITITSRIVVVSFSKEIAETEPLGNVGIDVKERNVTCSDTLGNVQVYDISNVAEIKERYRIIRSKIGRRTRQGKWISQKLYAEYGKRERDRILQALHSISKAIVQHAKENHLGIKIEKLTGIRKLYRKGNGQGRS